MRTIRTSCAAQRGRLTQRITYSCTLRMYPVVTSLHTSHTQRIRMRIALCIPCLSTYSTRIRRIVRCIRLVYPCISFSKGGGVGGGEGATHYAPLLLHRGASNRRKILRIKIAHCVQYEICVQYALCVSPGHHPYPQDALSLRTDSLTFRHRASDTHYAYADLENAPPTLYALCI